MSSNPNREHDRPSDSAFQRFVSSLTYPIRAFLSDAFPARDSMRAEQSIGEKLLGLVTAPFRFLIGFVVFMVQAWASSRSGWSFVVGIPAIAIAGMFAIGVWGANYFESTRMFGANAYNFNNSQDNPKLRTMFAENMVLMKPESAAIKFDLAQSRALANDLPGALDLMELLAPNDQPGYADAHIWRAQYLKSASAFAEDEQTRESLVQKHLDFAIELEPNHLVGHMSLAAFFDAKLLEVDENDPKHREYILEAYKHYSKLINLPVRDIRQLLYMPRMIEISKKMGGQEVARKQLVKIVDRIKPIADKNPDLFQIWLTLVRCAVQVGDYEMAQEFITQGFQVAQSPNIRQKIAALSADVLVQEADGFEDLENREQYINRLYSLSRAININPRSAQVYKRLLDYISQSSSASYNLSWLRESVAGAPYPGIIHSLLGLRAAMDGNEQVARTHWKVSQQQFALSHLVLNNLINTGAQTENADFQDPVKLLEAVIISFPGQAVLHRTLGFHLFKSNRQELAARAFEFAVEKNPKMLDARKFLFRIYSESGNHGKAQEQQRLLDAELEKLSPEQRAKVEKGLESIDSVSSGES